MIFKTIEDDLGKTKFGINDSFKGLFNGSFFKGEKLLSDNDIRALQAYNAEIERGVSPMTAYYRTMQDASDVAVNMAQSAGKGTVQINNMTKTSKAGQVALKGLAIAGNMAVSFGISLAIEGLIKLSESLSNTLDKQKEKLEETKNSISSYESEIDELQSKISENQKKIDEINANPLDIVDKNTLSTLKDENAELTQQLETIKAIKSDAKELAEVQTIQILENTSTISGLMQLINSLKEGKIFEEGFFDGLHNLNTGGLGFMHGFEDLKKGNYVKAVLKGVEGVVAPVGFIDALVAKKENELSPTEETEEQIKKVSELRTELQNLEKQRGSMDEEKYKKKHAELTEEFANEQTALISNIKSLQAYKATLDKSDPNQLEWIKKIQEVEDAYTASMIKNKDYDTFDEIINSEAYGNDKEKLIELASQGKLTAEVFDENYHNLFVLFNALGLSIDDVIDKLKSMGNIKTYESSEPSIISFSDAWKSAESETKEALLELASAGELTPETLESTEKYKELLKQTGLTAEQVANKINKMVDSSDQLASMSSGIKSLSENLGTKRETKQAIDADTLAGMPDELKECTEEWKEYERVMGDASSSYDKCKKATNELATAFVNSNNFLANLTSKTEGQYISQLKLMGVENAEEVVKNTLNNKIKAQIKLENAAKEKKIELSKATWEEIASTKVYNKASENARVAMQALYLQQNILSNSSLDMGQKIDALEDFITKIDEANSKIILLEANNVFNSSMSKYLKKTNGTDMSGANKYAQKQKEKYLAKQAKSLSKVKIKDNVSVTPPKSSSTKSTGTPSSSSSSSSSSKESKEEIDWIDRRLTSINNKLSLIKATYDNIADTVKNNDLFKIVDKQNSNLQKQEKYLQKLYNTAIRGADKYAKKANSIKLSSKLKNLVKSEAELGKKTSYKSLIKKYGQKTADKIAKYRDYYDKSLSLKQSAQDYKQQKTQAKIQRYQNRVDLYQDVIDKHDAQKENNTTAKEKEKHIKKQIEYTKKLYAHQIEIAKLEGNNQEVEKLKAEQIKKELDYKKEIQQNYADEAEARYNLNKQYESNAITAKEKNKYEAESLKDLKEQYSKLISIAKLDGDITEQKRLQAEYAEKELESRKQIFDNIQQEYDRKSNFLSQKNNAISNELAIAQARGEIIGEGYYTSQMVNTKSDLDLKKAERIELLNSLADIEFGTDKWYEAQEQLNSIDEGIQNDTKSLAEFQSAINDLKFDRFNELINKVDDVANETNFLTDMLDSDNFFDSDTGMISEDGITAMGLAAQNYDVYIAKAQEYDKAIEELNDMYANGEIGIESYNSKMRELRQEQQDAIKSWNDSKKSVIQYVRDGLNAQNEALQKAIELKKKLLEEEKDLKEWQDKVANSNKNIAKIQKQINALEGDDSEENRKKLQTLKSELQDAQKSHDDMLYDRSIEDQEKDLDDMLDKSKKQAEEYLKDTDKVFTDALNYINKHTEQVSHNLEKISKDIGFDISNYIGNAWKTSGNAVGEYKDILTSNIPGIISQIGIIRDSWLSVCNAANQAAEASAKASQNPVIETQNTGNNVSTQDTSKNQTPETSKNTIAEIIDNVVSKQPNASSAVTDLVNTLPTSNTNSNLTATLSNSGLTGSLSSNSSKILPSNSSKKKKVVDFIKANASKASKKRSEYAALNQYIYDKTGGKILSTKEEVSLAKLLGVSVKSDLSGKSDRDNILKALKKLTANSKFANGGILGDLVKVSGEDGLFIGSKGESVLTKEQTQAMLKLAPMIPQMNSMLGVINKPISNLSASSPHIEINTTIEGVATDQIVKDFEHVATQQAENVVKRINNATYTKGVRRR